ncbi:transglutaminase-like domain-containing protein [Agathobacter sp.]
MGDLELVGATLLTKPGNKGTHAIWPMTAMCFFSVMALFRIFLYAFSVSVSYPVLAAVGAALCVWFTFIFEYRAWDRYRFFVLLLSIMLWCFGILLAQDVFKKGLLYTFNCVAGQMNRTYQSGITLISDAGTGATIFFIFLFFMVAWLMAEAVIKRQDGAMFLFVAFPVVICSLLSGGRISKGAYFVLLLCFLGTYAGSSVRVRRRLWGKGDEAVFDTNVKEARRIANMLAAFCAGFGAVVVLLAFFVVRPAVNAPLSVVSDVTAPVKSSGLQFLYRFLPQVSGGRLNLSLEGVGGGVSDGVLGDVDGTAYDEVESLKVTVSEKPTEILYLKGYVGADYTQNRWSMGDADSLTDAALNWKTDGDSLLYIRNMPFLRMMYVQSRMDGAGEWDGSDAVGGEDAVSSRTISVERLNANTAYTYVPYQAYLNDYYDILGGDCSVQGQTAQDDRYEYFESSAYIDTMKKWMDVDASGSDGGDTVGSGSGAAGSDGGDSAGALGSYNHQNMLDELEASYESYVNTHYTDVPESQKRIEKLCKKKKKEWDKKLEGNLSDTQKQDLSYEKIDDVKNFVVRTLWERCEFSKYASRISDDEDYVERFMFEKKKGDSTAFASAAVVMFRSCGIPARYVVGYAAPANLFSGQADGSYMAVLQDDNAHAWVEIYMPDCGWTPVETTPGFAGTIANLDMPEADTEDTESIADKKDKDADRDGENTADTGADMKRIRQIKLVLGAVCGSLIVIIVLLLRIWYVKRRTLALDKRLSPGDRVRIIFRSFYELLERDGRLAANEGACEDTNCMDTTRPEFVDVVIATYPELVRSDFERFMELVLMANYGPDKLDTEDCEFAVVMYKRLKKLVARKAVVRGYF